MIGAAGLAAALLIAAQRTEIPPERFSAPNAFFTCMAGNLPSVGIDYDDMHREMDFQRYDDAITVVTLDDPVKSVVHEKDKGGGETWTILAEGPARNAQGLVAEGAPVRIRLVVRKKPGQRDSADFTVASGSFSLIGKDCPLAPARPRPGHMM